MSVGNTPVWIFRHFGSDGKWGTRHYSAAAITNITSAIAVTVSQSTGDVRIFKGGYPIMEIEKPARP
ncbi:MAG TPA: hypothetical protein ENG83_11890 [Nitrospirae bacterium]|nr:hypothetical protein [Nitrospirota bacterium]HDZ00484.1 hypothetical protein [Nitrospirota bacterium]